MSELVTWSAERDLDFLAVTARRGSPSATWTRGGGRRRRRPPGRPPTTGRSAPEHDRRPDRPGPAARPPRRPDPDGRWSGRGSWPDRPATSRGCGRWRPGGPSAPRCGHPERIEGLVADTWRRALDRSTRGRPASWYWLCGPARTGNPSRGRTAVGAPDLGRGTGGPTTVAGAGLPVRGRGGAAEREENRTARRAARLYGVGAWPGQGS